MEIPIIPTTNTIGDYLSMFKHYFSQPQYRNFTHYILGLIMCEGKRTISHLSRSQAHHKDYNRLHNFVSTAPWDDYAVNQQRIQMATKYIESKCSLENTSPIGFLIVDDTVNPKCGKTMPGFGFNYCSVRDEPIRSQAVVTTLYHYDEFDLPLHSSLYKSDEYCKTKRILFKTKNDLFVEQLDNITVPQGIRTIALMDAFYFNKQNCKAASKKDIDSIGRLKCNRRVLMSETDTLGNSLDKWFYKLRVHPRTFFTKITVRDRNGKKRQLWMLEKNVAIKNLGPIKLIMLAEKLRGKNVEPVFLGSTATDLTAEQIIAYYFERWAIETFFWTIKERLGFNHYQVRTEQATTRHWLLVFFAYSYLAHTRNIRGSTDTLGEIKRQLQRENSKAFVVHVNDEVKKKRKKVNAIYCDLAA